MKNNKDATIIFAIEPQAKKDFEKYCKSEFSTVSQTLRVFIHKKIQQFKSNES